jgi:hypothetical protein
VSKLQVAAVKPIWAELQSVSDVNAKILKMDGIPSAPIGTDGERV